MLEILPLLSAFVAFVVGVTVLVTHTHQRLERRIFAAACFAVVVWHFSIYIYWKSFTVPGISLWFRIAHMGAVWLPVLLYHFSTRWAGRIRTPLLVWVGYVLSGLFFLSAMTPWFLDDFFAYEWGLVLRAQWLFHFFLLYAGVYIILFYAQCLHWLRASTRSWERNRALYAVVGYTVLVFALVDVLPLYGIGLFPPFAYVSATISLMLLGYVMLKIRLPSVRAFFSRSLVFVFLTVYVGAGFTFLTFVVGVLLREAFGIGLVLPSMIVSVLVVVMFDPLKTLVLHATDRFFGRHPVDLHAALRALSETAGREVELDMIIAGLSQRLVALFKLDSIHFFLADPEGGLRQFGGLPPRHIEPHDPVLEYARAHRDVFVVDELCYHCGDARDHDRLCQSLHALTAAFACEVMIPVAREYELVGLVLIGQKRSGTVFSDEELHVLQVLAPQIASALHKAQLYQASLHFAERLRGEVKKATNELASANRVLRDMDQTKTNFISVASHQLRTPLTSVKGSLSMLFDGDYGSLSARQKQIISVQLTTVDDLTRLVDVFLQIPGLARESGRIAMKRVSLGAVFEELAREYTIRAERKGLAFRMLQPRRALVWRGDEERLKTVIRVLLDNSFRYTATGLVTLSLAYEKRVLRVSVHDTGKGIVRKELQTLFERFTRAADDGSLYTEGVGLGLFIAKRIVAAFGGKIWAESEGVGKGATFVVELPLDARVH